MPGIETSATPTKTKEKMGQQRKNRLVVAKRDHTHITGRKVEESFSNDENSIRRPMLTTGGTYICKLEIS